MQEWDVANDKAFVEGIVPVGSARNGAGSIDLDQWEFESSLGKLADGI